MARFGQALKPSKARSSFRKPQHRTTLRFLCQNCFSWASKLLHGTFWARLKSSKSPAAAFESLSTAQPQGGSIGLRNCSKARFGQALKPPKPARSLRKPSHRTKAPQAVSIGLRNFYMARFGQGPRSCFYSVGSFCRYPTFLLARPSTRCLVLALDAPGRTRRPNKRPAKWAPVRMLLRSLAHYTVLHAKPLAARAAMVNSPGPQLAGHRSVTKRASVNIFFGCHLAILDIKLVTAHASMVNLPTRQLTGNSALAKRARVNKIFGSDMSVFDLKSVSAHIAVIYLARAHGAAHSNLTEWANVLEWLCCSLLPKLLSWMWLHLHRAGRLRCVALFLCA